MNATDLQIAGAVAVPPPEDVPPDTPLPVVSIVIPTYRRTLPLVRALESCLAQRSPPRAEIVVVDNCPYASARHAVADFAARCPLPVQYALEPVPGMAAARNTGVAFARGEFVVFLDDDEEATPEWLSGLIETQRALDADAVFGPVLASAETGARGARSVVAEAQRTFTRQFAEPTGPMPPAHRTKLGAGNSLFRRALLVERPFDTARGLFGEPLIHDGGRIGWCREAVVAEYLPPQRLTLRDVMARRFNEGQARTASCAMTRPGQPVRAAIRMMVGAVQAAACSSAAVAAAVVEPELATTLICSAASGAGKVFWMRPFRAGARH